MNNRPSLVPAPPTPAEIELGFAQGYAPGWPSGVITYNPKNGYVACAECHDVLARQGEFVPPCERCCAMVAWQEVRVEVPREPGRCTYNGDWLDKLYPLSSTWWRSRPRVT